jgi:hypothetical protein
MEKIYVNKVVKTIDKTENEVIDESKKREKIINLEMLC